MEKTADYMIKYSVTDRAGDKTMTIPDCTDKDHALVKFWKWQVYPIEHVTLKGIYKEIPLPDNYVQRIA